MGGRLLSIALLVETIEQQQVLKQLIENSGHKLACCLLAEQFESEPKDIIADVWLININLGAGCYPRIESWLERLNEPLIFEEQQEFLLSGEYDRWIKRLSRKLHQLEGSINLERHPKGAAKFIWVLGASTGGPDTIKTFFNALSTPVEAGFIYVQHMNNGFEDTLIDLINKNSGCNAFQAKHGDVIAENDVAVIANETWIDVQPNGTLTVNENRAWPGAYSPSINQVFANVARRFGDQCGAIVFTGMGNDGADSLRLIRQQRGRVFAQSPETSTIAAMPEAAIASGIVECIASPEGLAELVEQQHKSDQ